eukprot:m.70120 g.70120  ORF g.70120 m.70120 type:complete len:456 (+) comp24180_c0_seq1:342-1709(+)
MACPRSATLLHSQKSTSLEKHVKISRGQLQLVGHSFNLGNPPSNTSTTINHQRFSAKSKQPSLSKTSSRGELIPSETNDNLSVTRITPKKLETKSPPKQRIQSPLEKKRSSSTHSTSSPRGLYEYSAPPRSPRTPPAHETRPSRRGNDLKNDFSDDGSDVSLRSNQTHTSFQKHHKVILSTPDEISNTNNVVVSSTSTPQTPVLSPASTAPMPISATSGDGMVFEDDNDDDEPEVLDMSEFVVADESFLEGESWREFNPEDLLMHKSDANTADADHLNMDLLALAGNLPGRTTGVATNILPTTTADTVEYNNAASRNNSRAERNPHLDSHPHSNQPPRPYLHPQSSRPQLTDPHSLQKLSERLENLGSEEHMRDSVEGLGYNFSPPLSLESSTVDLAGPLSQIFDDPSYNTTVDSDELDLVYDPELNCYFDPVTKKYYEHVLAPSAYSGDMDKLR